MTRSVVAVDLFAGGGGFSEGARMAGVDVAFAANHWPLAVKYHQANHPETDHACQDLHQIDWNLVPRHNLLIASPACQGHSFARDKERPYHDAMRATAWAVVACLERHRPEAFIVENVENFQRWELFNVWMSALTTLGYMVTTQVLNATAYGVPQDRDRLFVIGHRERMVAIPRRKAPLPAAPIIDWESGRWLPVARSRSPLVARQVAGSRPIHGERFLIGYHSWRTKGLPLDRPIGTVTTKRSWGVVDGDRHRGLIIPEYRRAMGFGEDYLLPENNEDALTMLGNAVPPPMAAGVISEVKQYINV